MGRFLENSICIKQIGAGLYETTTKLNYITDEYKQICVHSGFDTDGYSKPKWSKSIVDGSFGDDIRPAIIHDFLCKNRGYFNRNGDLVPVTFKEANDIFLECMNTAGLPWHKKVLYRIAVSFNSDKW